VSVEITADTVIAVLTGGQSRRMGRAKATLPLAGATVLEHILRVTEIVGLPRILVGSHETQSEDADLCSLRLSTGLPLVRDQYPDAGPLAGLHAVFAATQAQRVLLLACDLPFLTSSFLNWLLRQSDTGDSGSGTSVVPVDDEGRLHSLCAVYHESVRPTLSQALEARSLRFQDFVKASGLRLLGPEQWAGFDGDGQLLANINEPQDYHAALERFEEEG
jgi:molybdopterin-guanine dinucleotide biosynthesis protein A